MTKEFLSVPHVSTLILDRPITTTIQSGLELHRIHDERFGGIEFNLTMNGNTRFAPIQAPSTGKVIPTLYAAESFDSAVTETILCFPDTSESHSLRIRYRSDFTSAIHTIVRTTCPLKLLDLTIRGQRAIGIDGNALLAGSKKSYPTTREWAAAIHDNFPDVAGLYYSSHQYGPEIAILLFGDRCYASLEIIAQRRISDQDADKEIVTLARSLNMEYGDD